MKSITQLVIFLFLFTQGRLITGAEDAMKIDKKRGLAHKGEATTGTHARNLRGLQSTKDSACNCYCIIASGEMVKGKSIAIAQTDEESEDKESEDEESEDEESEDEGKKCVCTCVMEECDHSEDEDSDHSEDEDSDHSEDEDSGHSEDEDGDDN